MSLDRRVLMALSCDSIISLTRKCIGSYCLAFFSIFFCQSCLGACQDRYLETRARVQEALERRQTNGM